MSSFLSRARLAALGAAAVLLVAVGAAWGAAGDPLIIGQANNAGASQTILLSSGTGAAFTLRNSNVANGSTGIFGWSNATSGFTRGIYGRADSTVGTGVEGLANATTGLNEGVAGRTRSPEGVGVFGTILGSTGVGVWGETPETATEAAGVTGIAYGSIGRGVEGSAWGATGTGVMGFGVVDGGVGVFGQGDNWAGQFIGDVDVGGDLFVSGTCSGCTSATTAINGGKTDLAQGDAVAITGARPGPNGALVLVVRAARAGDRIVGLVDSALTTAERELPTPRDRAGSSAGPSRTEIHAAGTTVASGGYLRVVTAGIVAFGSADASAGAIAIGDALTVGTKPGKLVKQKAAGSSVGYALGALTDGSGRIAVYIDPR
jgi:hypothetical protein